MSLVVLGLSHHGAPLSLLESVALDPEARTALEAAVLRSEHVSEAVVVSTCNRTEVYAECLTFHGALADMTAALAQVCSLDRAELQPHLFVHYEDRGIAHVFTVAAGLDSMAVGEAQILGQVRRSLARAQRHGHVGPALNGVLQQALRVAKRVHTRDRHRPRERLARAGRAHPGRGRARRPRRPVGARHRRRGDGCPRRDDRRARRRPHRGRRQPQPRPGPLGRRAGRRYRPTPRRPARRPRRGRRRHLLHRRARPGRARRRRPRRRSRRRGGRRQVYVDLALPHDVDLTVAGLPGATRVGLGELGEDLADAGSAPQVAEASDLVTGEVAAFLLARSAEAVAPTVTALRTHAGVLVEEELHRLERRTPGLGDAERTEVRRALQRVVDKLLHTPTVRVKELAQEGQGGSYARALSELFDLDPRDVSLVSAPPTIPGEDDA